MDTVAPGATTGQSHILPSSVRGRLTWRPLAVRAAALLTAGVMHRTSSFMQHATGLSGWYEHLSRRMQPWAGWSPLSLALHADEMPLSGQRGEFPVSTHIEDRYVFASPNALVQPLAQRSAAPLSHPTALQQPRIVSSLPRPAVRLAVRQTVPRTTTTLQRAAVSQVPGTAGPSLLGTGWQPLFAVPNQGPREAEDTQSSGVSRVSPAALPGRVPRATDAPALAPRLTLTVSPAPRQEIRGGFPRHESTPPGLPAAEQTRPEPMASPLAQWTTMQERFAAVPGQHVPPGPEAFSTAQGVIEQLIERTVQPVSLPGVELRLVPAPQVPALQPATQTADGGQATPNGTTPPTWAPAPLPPPALDINAVADKVYQTLQRRQQLERERKGLY